jgi:(1->4)-alpha-D-glucan 1-alpha-D-glucosylmutase
MIEDFVDIAGWPGRVVSLAQTLLKLTSPGVPDIYQGTEVWDLSLVDPDNRRAVDFSRLSDLLGEVAAERADGVDVDRILAGVDDGLPKLWVTARTLWARRHHPQAFEPGASYRPLLADGDRADDVIAYLRGDEVVTVAPRRVGVEDWGDTALTMPDGPWYDVLAGQGHDGGVRRVAEMLGRFPVALLVARSEAA